VTGAAATETVRVEGLAAGGRGVARLDDGRVCFVPLAAPSDLLDIAIGRDHGRWAEASIVRIHEGGTGRRDAPCPHYARCGGCSIQHLEYAAQLDAKARIVADALARIGGWDAPPPPIEGSPREWRYRNRMTFTLRRLPGGRIVAGLYARSRRGRVVDIDERCLLPEEPLAAAWGALRRAWGPHAERLPAGRELRLTLRALRPDGVSLGIEGGRGVGDPEALAAAVPELREIWHRARGADGARRLYALEARGEGRHGFTQVNVDAAAALAAHVLEVVAPGPGLRVVDAYAGEGAHARAAAGMGAQAVAIERDAAAVARDIARLAAAYEPRSARCFDLFPQTAHVETVVELCATT
jgi:23S rRNA (uracil1939-C5)-methyltransferase